MLLKGSFLLLASFLCWGKKRTVQQHWDWPLGLALPKQTNLPRNSPGLALPKHKQIGLVTPRAWHFPVPKHKQIRQVTPCPGASQTPINLPREALDLALPKHKHLPPDSGPCSAHCSTSGAGSQCRPPAGV